MNTSWKRGRYLSKKQAESIIDGAKIILSQIGIKIASPFVLEYLRKAEGIYIDKNRVKIKESTSDDFLFRFQLEKEKENKHGTKLFGEPSLYTYRYRESKSGKIHSYTTQTLGAMTRFVEKASIIYPVKATAPGYPSDVPTELASLARCKIALENSKGPWMMAPDSAIAADYMFEMAEVMEQKLTELPVYMISPLTLGGDSLEIVLKHAKRLKSFYTFAMPNMGITTPMNISMGLSVALAEVLGGAILVECMTGLKADIKPNLFPFDLKNFNIAFGTPEKFLIEQMAAELLAWIRNDEVNYTSTNIHTWAKEANGIAAMEKGMMVMAGALQGAKKFYCVGSNSLDELFDPLQMIQDLEEIMYAQRLIDGLPRDEIENTFMEEIREGIRTGFILSDRTLDDYEEYMSTTLFSPKENLQKWVKEGERSSVDYLKEIYYNINAEPLLYALEKNKQKEIDRIFSTAILKNAIPY